MKMITRNIRRIDEIWTEITTPYLDRHNDYLQIFVKQDDDGYVLTDDGWMIDEAAISGHTEDFAEFSEYLEYMKELYGVEIEEEAITIKATAETFILSKHKLIQAMLDIAEYC
jgi:hypothetical protein